MTIQEVYVITTETSIIFPYFSEDGRLKSMIMEGEQLLIVNCKPMDVIDFNLRRSGSSLQGATDETSELLANRSMFPIVISKTRGIYWTPSCSPTSPECIWIAVGHVGIHVKNEKNQVTVTLQNGSQVNLPKSHYQFTHRIHRACTRRYRIETNTRQGMKVRENDTQSYIVHRKDKGLNFENE